MAKVSFKRVAVANLKVDLSYQRKHDSTRVRTMRENWRSDLSGMISVSMRDDGSQFVIDGWHRRMAALGANVPTLYAKVWEGLTLQQEAEIFISLNQNVSKVTPGVCYRGEVIQGVEHAVFLKNLMDSLGYKITGQGGDRGMAREKGFRCYTALVECYKAYGTNGLELAIHTIHAVWPKCSSARQAPMVRGMSHFLHVAQSLREYNHTRFTSKLKRIEPDEILRGATRNVKTSDQFIRPALALLDYYNRGAQKEHRLDPIYFSSPSLFESFTTRRFIPKAAKHSDQLELIAS